MTLPECSMPYAREIFVGRGVSIYFDHQPSADWPAHTHSQLEFMLFGEEADCEISWRDAAEEWRHEKISGSKICVIPPRVVHTCAWRKAADMVLLYVEPELNVEKLKLEPEVAIHEFSAIAGQDVLIWQLFSALREVCYQDSASERIYFESLGTVLATHLVKAHILAATRRACHRSGLSTGQLNEVVAYIYRNLGEGIPVAALARTASVSPYHFMRLFKQSTGLSPHRYVLKCRLLKAKELLATREFRVADAAYETGFCDQSHLNRHFKKFFGFTPTDMLRQPVLAQ